MADVDLLKHLQKWKDTAKEMRELIGNVEKQVRILAIHIIVCIFEKFNFFLCDIFIL